MQYYCNYIIKHKNALCKNTHFYKIKLLMEKDLYDSDIIAYLLYLIFFIGIY